MQIHRLHTWDVSLQEAVVLQREMAARVVRASALKGRNVRRIAGVDLSPEDASGTARAAIVVLRYPGLEVEEVATAEGKPPFPYIPGFLSFRESPSSCWPLRSSPTTLMWSS